MRWAETDPPVDPLSLVAGWPARAAVAIVGRDGERTVGPTDEPFGWASVTKLLASMAVFVALEEGTVHLDDPVGPPGSTLRHVLAHASGLAPDSDDVLAPPATRRIYSNRGIELALDAVAHAAGMPWATYLHEGVIQPLGMHATTVTESPAWGATGPLSDLVALARELWTPTLVAPSTLAEATTVSWPGLPGVLPGFGYQPSNDWGLGIELRAHKSPHWTGRDNSPETYGHFGRSGSFLWVDPVNDVAAVGLADRDFGPWAVEVWPTLADAVIADARSRGERQPGTDRR